MPFRHDRRMVLRLRQAATIAQCHAFDMPPIQPVRQRRKIRLAVCDREVAEPIHTGNARLIGLRFGHTIKHTHGSRCTDQSNGTASVFNGCLAVAHLAQMVHNVDGAVRSRAAGTSERVLTKLADIAFQR